MVGFHLFKRDIKLSVKKVRLQHIPRIWLFEFEHRARRGCGGFAVSATFLFYDTRVNGEKRMNKFRSFPWRYQHPFMTAGMPDGDPVQRKGGSTVRVVGGCYSFDGLYVDMRPVKESASDVQLPVWCNGVSGGKVKMKNEKLHQYNKSGYRPYTDGYIDDEHRHGEQNKGYQ